ncbi:uncharacterized protein EV154DRAFT_94963 [Mucor mucedo]|uniref:uncharacterized protein n=1 Tax=Mucor mucedo TaxID=29922 RepID=UPI00221EB2EB|nr:uncharacterized protein EV154DRAFT_94963 [Mucor mucedo]KAI7873397.1 hypothetical protein EV154DRAFT_94963 [Mucor mucedo]
MSGNNNQTYEHNQVVTSDGAYYHDSDDHGRLRDDEMMEEYSEKAPPPTKPRFYKTKKYWIICSINTVIVVIVAVVLALYVIFPKVAQSLMNKSKIDVSAAAISFTKPESLTNAAYSKRDGDDMNSTFYMSMESDLSKTGPFHATIKFHNPVQIYYNESYLGDIFFYEEAKIASGKGKLNAVTPFMIRDQAAFAEFSKTMLAVEEFKWTLKGKLDITALSRTATVNLNKEITLNGMNGFPNVKIDSFGLPGDDPKGGILMELGTVLESPSPIGVQLGTIKLAVAYDGVSLGIVSADGVTLQKGENRILLKGSLVPQNDTASLDKISVLFSNYIAGVVSTTTAVGVSCAPDGVNPIGWLSEGFKTVNLKVGLGAPAPLKIINGVSMGYLDLKFDPSAPYAPVINAPAVTANFQMPFGFSLNVTELTQSITVAINTSSTETANFAVMNVQNAAAVSDQAAGTIKFALNNTTMAGIAGQESIYNKYTYALTASNNYTFMVSGSATTKAMTPLGPITLSGINFTVPTTLQGLNFLNSTATVINSLDVTGGTATGLNLAINVTMSNPSDFGISTGDVSFNMGASGVVLGLVTLNNLTLNRGENTVSATSTFDPKSSDVGQNLLSTFVMGSDNAVDITGYANSTSIVSLAEPLSVVTLASTLPGLTAALIQGSALIVLPDTLTTGIVGVKVSIANPFSAGLSITKVVSAVTFGGMPMGNIDQDISSNPFVIGGKAIAESAPFNMAMNLEPASVALLLRTLAVQSNMDTKPLDALFGLGGLEVEGQESVEADADLFTNFDISKFTTDAMAALKVDLSLSSALNIGEYSNDLAFSQAGVAVATDSSVLGLVPLVGQPIVQQIVDGSVLSFKSVVMSEVTEKSFKVQMKGSIKDSGPMFATISFPAPLTVVWQGKTIGTVTMADINAKPLVGADFDVPGVFTVADSGAMGEFSAYLINNPEFVWDITSSDVSVKALGFTFTKIALHKIVKLAGASGFKDAVTVTSFDLPADHPDGGIALTVNTVIKNPSQVGFNLGGVAFENFFGDVDLGPLSSDGAAVFNPQGSSNVPMKGRLVPQTTREGIIAVTTVFGHYLSGNSSTLTVKGVSGSGPQGEVSWLTAAFKTLTIGNVILPGPEKIPVLIPSIEMRNMQLDFTKDPWAPPTSSSQVEAQLANPFGFPLGVKQLNMKVEATYEGNAVASLDVPDNAATTSPSGLITTSFKDVPFVVANKPLFAGFVQLLTLSPSVTFGLQGTSNAIAHTSVGDLTLPGIHFAVDTTLKGFSSFNKKVTIISLKISGATASYVIVDLTVQMENPSDTTITVGDINFDVLMPAYNNARVGLVYMKDLTISPGSKTYTATMHLGEMATSAEAVGAMFYNYMTGTTVPLVIQGTERSTPIAPLNPALKALTLASAAPGTQTALIKKIFVTGSLDDFTTLKGYAYITIENPLDTPITILGIKALSKKNIICTAFTKEFAGYQTVGTIDFVLPTPATVGAHETVELQPIPVGLPGVVEGLQSALGDKHVDVEQHAEVIVGNNFHVSDMVYTQKNVPMDIYVPMFSEMDGFNETCMTDDHGIMGTSLSAPVISSNASSTAVPTFTTTVDPVTTALPTTTTAEAPATTTDAPAATTEEPVATTTEAPTQTEAAPAPTSTL